MLETKDLLLRQGKPEDWEELHRNLWSRESVFHYMFSKACTTEEAGRKRTEAYAQMHKEVLTEFFVLEKHSNQIIGIAGLKKISPKVYTVTDIAIGRDYAGKSYGKQILFALIDLAFAELDAAEVHYNCFTQNEISKRLALSCGFVYTHSEKAVLKKNDEPVILDYYTYTKRN